MYTQINAYQGVCSDFETTANQVESVWNDERGKLFYEKIVHPLKSTSSSLIPKMETLMRQLEEIKQQIDEI